MALTDNLVAYWKLEEAAGQVRVDVTGRGNDLTENATVTRISGRVGYAAGFLADGEKWLYRAHNADLTGGDADFTIAVWTKVLTSSFCGIVGKVHDSSPNSQYDYKLYQWSDGVVYWEWLANGGGVGNFVGATPRLQRDVWHLVIGWHDSINNVAGIQIDNNSPNTLSWSGGINSNAAHVFKLGRTGHVMNGGLDEAGVWRRVLTSDERSQLFNSNEGLTYPFTSSGGGGPVIGSRLVQGG